MAENLIFRTTNLLGELELEDETRNQFDSDLQGPNLNPLCNPYILQRIFDYLAFADLKACRLVSKLWEEEANEQLIPISAIVVDNLKRMEKYTKEFLFPPEADLSKFALALDVHFNQSKLIEWKDKSAQLDQSVVDFIMTHGECIKILTLDLSRTPEPHLRQILQRGGLINLQKLIVKSEAEDSIYGPMSNYKSFRIKVLASVTELEVAEHKRRYNIYGKENFLFCDPWRLGDLVQALPNLKKYTKIEDGERTVLNRNCYHI